jgi:GrpB-like predicted nucleotidyltransferase (UPF0157 family)
MTTDDRIEIHAYDPEWPARFLEEAMSLEGAIKEWMAGPIEHIGSTAVPGLCAKPVIDIMIPVHSLDDARPALGVLERFGYHYWPYKADEMHWFCKPSERVRTHHVHMVPLESRLFQERLAFRDALRGDAEVRQEYSELKWSLARVHGGDREAYTDGKGPFVRRVIACAIG